MFNTNKINKNSLGYNIISEKEPMGVVAEQYRKLRTNIEYSSFNKELKVVNLTSAFQSEGKSVTALNLSTVYAQSEIKTLLIDMDLRRPKIHRAFQLSNAQGLSNLVTQGLSKEDVIHEVNDYLHVLPSGEKMPYPAEFLMSKKLHALIDEFRKEYDRIIIDTPPMTAVTDASIVGKFCDGTIMVVASRQTDTEAAKNAVKQLKENGSNIIGGILTRVSKKDNRYMNYYYEYK